MNAILLKSIVRRNKRKGEFLLNDFSNRFAFPAVCFASPTGKGDPFGAN